MTTPTVTTTVPAFSGADKADIQGNVVGFKNDHQRLIFINFPDAASGKAFLRGVAPEIASANDLLAINWAYKWVFGRGPRDPLMLQSSSVNIALSSTGLQVIGAPDLQAFPVDFSAGMAARAADIGDVESSAPAGWLAPFAGGARPHAVVIVAADDAGDLDARSRSVTAIAGTAGVTVLPVQQDGNVRPGDQRGHEHFGFKDGISQPGIAGLTVASKGGDPIAAGEFLIGYPDQDGLVSGQPGRQAPPPIQGQPGYGQPVPPPAPALPAWAHNGSFLVYRRLRQDVNGFHQFTAQQAASVSLTSDQLAAKLVGRWPSGAPLEAVEGFPATAQPEATDPSVGDPALLDDKSINNFVYAADPAGERVPRAAHIRKVYPRDQAPPGDAEADRHRILRRGIPYGPEVVPSEPAYGSGPIPDNQDRGLLFLCYQASIARGFEFIQQTWANAPAFPQEGDGVDPIISQAHADGSLTVPPSRHLQLQRWVTTTGGDYYFSPSISALGILSS
jgi:Dyp-type peroxidase family